MWVEASLCGARDLPAAEHKSSRWMASRSLNRTSTTRRLRLVKRFIEGWLIHRNHNETNCVQTCCIIRDTKRIHERAKVQWNYWEILGDDVAHWISAWISTRILLIDLERPTVNIRSKLHLHSMRASVPSNHHAWLNLQSPPNKSRQQ